MKPNPSKNILIGLAVAAGILLVFTLTRAYDTRSGGAQVATFDLAVPGSQVGVQAGVPVPAAQNGPLPPRARGDRLFEQGRYGDAIPEYRKAVQLDPKDADSYNDLGLALHYIGKSEEAVEILKKGTQARPNFQRIWLTMGFVLTQAGKKEEAALALQTAVGLGPNTPQGKEALRLLRG